MLLRVLAVADVAVQQDLVCGTERLFRAEGHGEVFDAWGEALRWVLEYGH
jgi:hypothetical protein